MKVFLVLVGALAASSAFADTQRIRCGSHDGKYTYCRVSGRVTDAWLVHQNSDRPCREDRTWGWDNGGVWVDDGCRGEFDVETRPEEVAAPTVTLHSKGDSYYCPSTYQGLNYSRADVRGTGNARISSDGCSIPDKSSDCSVTCYYR